MLSFRVILKVNYRFIMGILRFASDDLRFKLWPEYKLRPLNSTSSEPTNAVIMLVHNQGVYLVADSKLPESQPENSIIYAEGCDPRKDEDWYQYSRQLVGGDDFSQELPAEWFESAALTGCDVCLEVTESGITLLETK